MRLRNVEDARRLKVLDEEHEFLFAAESPAPAFIFYESQVFFCVGYCRISSRLG
jgi:hypothetical protein